MDLEEGTADGSKRLSEPFFLKKILIEKAGDTSDLTTLATSVHAVKIGSGFVLLNNIIMAALIVMDTLKFEKQASSSSYREVFVFWRRVKDCISTPLLIGLCDKSGLELPPCLMRLPTELKLKILELFLARILPTWLAFVQRCGIWWLQTMAWGKEVSGATYWRQRQHSRRVLRPDMGIHCPMTSPRISPFSLGMFGGDHMVFDVIYF
ncbi:hypothetical protein IGI04_012460 [Brassica rapa subsp. trilocularis]|uniref:Uncharacterized protein n=1 Tax=Brassica rapa subsp. trilocularis TaxID=1813537 RepID=A0ABQ7N831_BRACM|nr:hypothetical protein IGI04_012460 [Brassica rapa subsp. trilocularis]